MLENKLAVVSPNGLVTRLLQPMQPKASSIKALKVAGALDYSGDPFNHVAEYFGIVRRTAQNRIADVMGELGTHDIFSATMVALESGLYSVGDLPGDGEQRDSVLSRLHNLTPVSKAHLANLVNSAISDNTTKAKIVAAKQYFVVDTIRSAVSDIYRQLEMEPNRAQLAVFAYVMTHDELFRSQTFMQAQFTMLRLAASPIYTGAPVSGLTELLGCKQNTVTYGLNSAMRSFGAKDHFSTVSRALDRGFFGLKDLGWNLSDILIINERLSPSDRAQLSKLYNHAIEHGSIGNVTVPDSVYHNVGTGKNLAQLAVVACAVANMDRPMPLAFSRN